MICAKVADTREELGATQGDLRKTQDEMANSQVVAQQALAAARAEASELQGIVECQRERIAGLEVTMKSERRAEIGTILEAPLLVFVARCVWQSLPEVRCSPTYCVTKFFFLL